MNFRGMRWQRHLNGMNSNFNLQVTSGWTPRDLKASLETLWNEKKHVDDFVFSPSPLNADNYITTTSKQTRFHQTHRKLASTSPAESNLFMSWGGWHVSALISRLKSHNQHHHSPPHKQLQWTQIGGYEDVKNSLYQRIMWPILYAESWQRLGIQPAKGALLFGPSGCGKTLMANTLAHLGLVNYVEMNG